MENKNRNAAIWYQSDCFDASGRKLPVVGRTAAGEGFLKALVTHGGLETLYCFSESGAGYDEFRSQVARLYKAPPETALIRWSDSVALEKPGCLYLPAPNLDRHAWTRRSTTDQRSYSLCGVTHTTAHHETMDAIGALITTPVQAWDALVCTSQVVYETVSTLLNDWSDYLEDRGAGKIRCPVQLPVIPLGVDCDQFETTAVTEQARVDIRRELGAQDNDIIVLYLGRLSVNIKTNPWAMLTSLEEAARRTNRKIYLVLAGWFQDDANASTFSDAIRMFCQSVNTVLVDGRQDRIRRYAWFAADIFISLIDNVQETFGISPLEAMAAGLPLVVTDWNGYRDTVVDGVTGFRIPTAFPAGGAGDDIAYRFAAGLDTFENYLGHCSAATVIDRQSCVDALVRLIEDRQLRERLGNNGRRHVRENYDWKVVMHQYQELWQELARRRKADAESVSPRSGRPANPLRQDPFRLFASYPSASIDEGTSVQISPDYSAHGLTVIRGSSLFASALPLLLSEERCREIMAMLVDGRAARVGDIEQRMESEDKARLRRTIAWLAKTGLIKIHD